MTTIRDIINDAIEDAVRLGGSVDMTTADIDEQKAQIIDEAVEIINRRIVG